jgi:hypothetical protein
MRIAIALSKRLTHCPCCHRPAYARTAKEQSVAYIS